MLSELGCSNEFGSASSQCMRDLISKVENKELPIPLFKVIGTSRSVWVKRVADTVKLSAHVVSSLQGERVAWSSGTCCLCLSYRHSVDSCDLLNSVERQNRELNNICGYPICSSSGTHSTEFCPHLNGRCDTCHFRGHLTSDSLCRQTEENHRLFNDWSEHGSVTQHAFDIRSASCGFYPILTVTGNRLIEALGGYAFLHAMPLPDAISFVEHLQESEVSLLGVEPFLTELTVRGSLEFFQRRRQRQPGSRGRGTRSASRGGSRARD